MKTTIKILILCIACVIAIGVVMSFAKTKVSPPKELKEVQQYQKDVTESVDAMAKSEEMSQKDSIFDELVMRINVFESENKLTKSMSGTDVKFLARAYSPGFLKTCFKKFKESVWNDADHSWMQNRIMQLKSLKTAENEPALKNSTVDSLNLVSSIIDKYHKALQISRTTSFPGWSSVGGVISQARSYANDEYLGCNTALVSALNGVKDRMEQSAYNNLAAQVQRLAGFRSVSQSTYDNSIVPQVEQALKDYEVNAKKVFGSARSTSDLWSKAETYAGEASFYYNSQNPGY